ncbi:MAG: FHIPEP family type III secretion protein, partial [Methylocapsa sp.]|nr:FHIPEP family type III secretion protein [Methylocapsa sp.]
YPRAVSVAALLMLLLGTMPGLPMFPFAVLGGLMAYVGYAVPKQLAAERSKQAAAAAEAESKARQEARDSVKESVKSPDIELCLGKQLAAKLLVSHGELAARTTKMRRKFAKQYGFVVPDIKLSDRLSIPAKSYQILIHGTAVASHELRLGEVLVIPGDGGRPDLPGEEVREPAFGMRAMSIPEAFLTELKRKGFTPIDNVSVLLTHLSEVIRNNLAQLLSYKDMRMLLDRLGPEYKRLIDDICPSQISHSGLLAVLKLLLAERVSIRNLHLILEAVAEAAPHVRRSELLAEHVRMRMAQQICGDLMDEGALKILRLGNRWDMAFHQSLKRDTKGEIVEFDLDPVLIDGFGKEASAAIRERMDQGHNFALVATPDARAYVRMVIERLFPTLPVLSHVEIPRGVEVKSLGTVS